jgi:hypothetical protein
MLPVKQAAFVDWEIFCQVSYFKNGLHYLFPLPL